MQVHYNIAQLQAFSNAFLTIGTFDGVHTGHQQIIQLMKDEAAKVNGETVIITFHPHPRRVISGQKPLFLINTLEEKLSLLDKYGIQHVVVVPFTEAFANQTAEAYIRDFLVKIFHPHTIIIGHDHRFGKNRQGDFQLLEDKAADYGYEVKEIPGFMLDNVTISSTKIRAALLEDDMDTANHFLGYDYFFSGKVVEGNKLGRTIGYPTANLQITDEQKLIPGNGVYAVEVVMNNEWKVLNGELSMVNSERSMVNRETAKLKGMMNIGVRPTVDGTKRMIEVNLFDFDREIYGEILTVSIRKHLRNEQKFDGLESLKNQLAKDKIQAIAWLKVES